MKLKEDFITYESDGEQILVCASGAFSGLARGNKTAAFIIECLKEDVSAEQIAEKMAQKYTGAPMDVMLNDVKSIIAKLREIGAIED